MVVSSDLPQYDAAGRGWHRAARQSCLPDSSGGVSNRVFAPQQDGAAHQDEEQEQHESDQVENQTKRCDHTAEAEGLQKEQRRGDNRDPPKPPRQDSTPEHEHASSEREETAEDVRDAPGIRGRR